MAGPGGARPGAGRRVGTLDKKKLILIERAKELGEEPIVVMLQNMNYYHSKGQAVVEKVGNLLAAAQGKLDGDIIQQLTELMKLALSYRDRAQSCAVDAAPYIHPKLSAIAFSGNPDDELTKAITESMAPKEAAAAYIAVLGHHR